MTIELQRPSTQRSRHAIFPSILPLTNFRVTVHPSHLPCGAEDSILQLAWASGKKELDVTRGVEDHIEYIAVELALGRRHALEVVHRKGDLGPSREKRGAKVGRVRRDKVYRLDEGGPVLVLFRERD